jgi:hypothetical protein
VNANKIGTFHFYFFFLLIMKSPSKYMVPMSLAAALVTANCSTKEQRELPLTAPSASASNVSFQPVVDAGVQQKVSQVLDGGSELKVEKQSQNFSIPESKNPQQPRYVGVLVAGTKDISWVPEGYFASPMISKECAGTDCLMVSSFNDSASRTFSIPATVEEVFIQAGQEKEFQMHWSKNPEKPSRFPASFMTKQKPCDVPATEASTGKEDLPQSKKRKVDLPYGHTSEPKRDKPQDKP